MNLEQAKVLFFAQHHGQTCVMNDGDKYAVQGHIIDSIYNEVPGFLLLRSVSQSTTEENLIIASLSGFNVNHAKKIGIYVDPYFSIDENYIEINITARDDSYYPISHSSYQYLLRIGILLPFTYLNEENKPITLQPDEIINLGWAKYQE